jgi:spore germination cell wall hydrolase CwlJ-like protein
MKTTIALCLIAPSLLAGQISQPQAIRAIIGEASGESYRGMVAIGCALRNRGTLQGVYGAKAGHADKEPATIWRQATLAWIESAKQDITHGATHWESTDFKTPAWARRMKPTVRIGKHQFYTQ